MEEISLPGSSWTSYPKIWNVGHRALTSFFDAPVIVEEKVDGSQFSFGKFRQGDDLVLRCRSRGCQLNVEAPEKMFSKGVETARALFDDLTEGWTYRGEFLAGPKHNTLAYGRVPDRNVILFDINTGLESYLPYDEKEAEARRLGLEVVPLLFEGVISSHEQFFSMLERTSVLGGQKIEGVVCKSYDKFGIDGKVLMAKFVSEAFKEIHQGDWKERNPGSGDITQALVAKYRSPARWAKSVQHLREAGKLTDSPRDIGPLLAELEKDTLAECEAAIMSDLMKWAWPNVKRGLVSGFPEWYKEELVKLQFKESE